MEWVVGVVDEILGHSRGGKRDAFRGHPPPHLPAPPTALYAIGRRAAT